MDTFFSRSPERKNDSSDSPPPKINFSAIAAIEEATTSPPVKVKELVEVCREAIQSLELDRLVTKAKKDGFKLFLDAEKEMLCAGVVKLGEALTFCRDRRNKLLGRAGIIDDAINYAEARNYFIHHHMYCELLEEDEKYRGFELCISKLTSLENINSKLSLLEETGLDELTKKITKGTNNFQFEYSHFVKCLKNEFAYLDKYIAVATTENPMTSLTRLSLDNRIRNILSILSDLLDANQANKNKGAPGLEFKEAMKRINAEFIEKNKNFAVLFSQHKDFRNALSHMDKRLPKPYTNDTQRLEFAKELNALSTIGYLDLLEREFLSKPAPAPQAGTPSTPKKSKTSDSPALNALLAYTEPKSAKATPVQNTEKIESPDVQKEPSPNSSARKGGIK
ncbi:MAG TPA: hypothetical protein VGV92_07610 [Gammaproteobacteria bacterium]|nr:hypothetical protein [Gammaproteobacteria bacterium]